MSLKSYCMTIFNAMARGLFATLIVGTILKQLALYAGIAPLGELGRIATLMMGAGIGLSVALARGAKPFTQIAAAVCGLIGAGTFANATPVVGDPMGALLAALVALEVGLKSEKGGRFDLLLIPPLLIAVGGVVGLLISPYLALLMKNIGMFINELTLLQPIPMGILLGVSVGVLLTLPISSAAICIAIGIDGLAAGAAVAGCCAQMVGFAVISFRDNRYGGLLAQGLGTSMLQIPNIIKNPWIWLPPTIASGVAGLASILLGIKSTSIGAGMGTSGLIGPLQTLGVMGSSASLAILVVQFVLPILIAFPLAQLLLRLGKIKSGDMKL